MIYTLYNKLSKELKNDYPHNITGLDEDMCYMSKIQGMLIFTIVQKTSLKLI